MDETAEPNPGRLSKTPSWIMLGFLLGVLFVILLPDRERDEPEAAVQKSEQLVLPSPQLSTVETQFEAYGKYAVWDNDTTEVRIWNPEAKAFIDCYEVLRSGDKLYFRSIPELTRPLLDHGIPENLSLQFTEPEERRKEWLKAVNKENIQTFTKALLTKPAVGIKPADPEPAVPPQGIPPGR